MEKVRETATLSTKKKALTKSPKRKAPLRHPLNKNSKEAPDRENGGRERQKRRSELIFVEEEGGIL